MKKILFILLLPLTLFGQSQKISDMTSATTLAGTEYVPIVQSTNKKATVSLLRGFGSYGTAGQLLKVNSGATGFDFFSPSYLTALTNGSGTTANGSAVDLGGTVSSDVNLVWGTDNKNWYFGQGQSSDNYTPYIEIIKAPTAGSLSSINMRANGITSGGAYRGFVTLQGFTSAAIAEIGIVLAGVTTKFGFDPGGAYLNLGSDATGDTYYRNSSGYLTRLPAGTNGHVLTLSGGLPSWAAPSGGGLTVGTTTITSGTNTRILYNNSGVLGEYTVSGSGNVAMTTSPVFTTPNIGTATGTASGNWFGTGTTTLTGAVSVVGTATNKFQFQTNGLGTSNTDEFLVENTTAATSGNQQAAAITIGGKGWKTNATAASQDVKFQMQALPVQGSANPSGYWVLRSSINGGAYTPGNGLLLVSSSGDAYLNSSLTISNGRYIQFNGGAGHLYMDLNSQLNFRANANTGTPSGGFYRFYNNSGNYTATSGTQLIMGIENNFAPTSGTAIMEGLTLSGTINQTGGANGEVRGVTVRPTYTAATTGIGFYYNPSGTPTNNYAFYATSGKIKLDESPTLNATADRILTYNNSSKLVEYRTTESIAGVSYSSVVEGSYTGGSQVTNVYDGSELTDGQIAYVEVVVTAVQSSGTVGATGYSMKVKGAFRKSGGTLTQIGSSVLDEPLATWNDTGDSFTGTPGLSVSSGAVAFSQNLTTSKTFAYKFSTRVVKK